MGSILFLIHKTSDENYHICLEAINSLRKVPGYNVKYAAWSNPDSDYGTSDAYITAYECSGQDFTVVLEDTTLLADEAILLKMIAVFQQDAHIGVVGIIGAEKMAANGKLTLSEKVYGACYVMDAKRDAYELKFNSFSGDYVEVDAVDSTMFIIRGYIPVWSHVPGQIFGEAVSVAAFLQGTKVVVSRLESACCLCTIGRPVLSEQDLQFVQDKYILKQALTGKEHYLLTIGIPTFNRSKYFKKCIANIYRQVGNMPWIEVFVSNNASTDDTEKIALQYESFSNFRYYRQPYNIEGKNFDYLYENARGDFVVACGDDDYYTGEALLNLLEVVCLYPEATVIELEWPHNRIKPYIECGVGLDNFLIQCTDMMTCISCIVLNRKCYSMVEDKYKFSHTHLNQVYVQMEMVRHNPEYAVIHANNFGKDSGEAVVDKVSPITEKTPFCSIFLEEYYPILEYFLDKGLSRQALEEEKIANYKKVYGWLWSIKRNRKSIQWKIDDDLEAIMKKHYGDAPYYDTVQEAVRIIRA